MIGWLRATASVPRTAPADVMSRVPPVDGRVLITGATGRVGVAIRPWFARWWRAVRLSDITPLPAGPGSTLAPNEELVVADVRDREAVDEIVRGVDAVVHLAGLPTEESLERLMSVNVGGFDNVLRACVQHGVRRVVLASTMHVLGGYRRDEPVTPASRPRPDSRYAVSKLAAEELAAYYTTRSTLRVRVVRIGCHKHDREESEPGNWIGTEDMSRLLHTALCHDGPPHLVVHGVTVHAGHDCGQRHLERTLGFRFLHHGASHAEELAKAERWYHDRPQARDYRGGEFLSYELEGPTPVTAPATR